MHNLKLLEPSGSWSEALDAAGIPRNRRYRIPKQDVVDDAVRVYNKNGKLTREIYEREGEFSVRALKRNIGDGRTWNSILEELGMEINCPINILEEELIADLIRLMEEFGKVTSTIIKDHGKFSLEVYWRRLGGTNKSLEKSGIPINRSTFSAESSRCILMFENILKEKAEREKTFDWLVNPDTGRKLRIDAYFPKSNICLEYNGKQHYKRNSSFGSSDFDIRKHRDIIKEEMVLSAGIKFITVRYDEEITEENMMKKIR